MNKITTIFILVIFAGVFIYLLQTICFPSCPVCADICGKQFSRWKGLLVQAGVIKFEDLYAK
jgi:hypothetical protein